MSVLRVLLSMLIAFNHYFLEVCYARFYSQVFGYFGFDFFVFAGSRGGRDLE